KSGAATGMNRKSGQASLFGHFVKSAVTIIAMEEERLAISRTGFQRVNLRVHVAVSYKKVEPGIIVHIKESRTPANIRIAGLAYSRSPAHIIKSFGAKVPIQRVGLLFKMSHKKTQAAAVVIIAKIYTHISKFKPFTAERHTRKQANVSECAVVIIVVEIVRH